MSQQNQAAKKSEPTSELDQLRSDVKSLRGLVADMAFLFIPPALRSKCECGRIACRHVTLSKPGVTGFPVGTPGKPDAEPDARQKYLCDSCEAPEGWNVVGSLELGPVERETVRLANKLILIDLKA